MRRVFAIVFCALLMLSLCSCGTVDEPCDWCGSSPSKAYKTSSGTTSYVCKECSGTCMICGNKKATKHATNMLDMELFMCDDCYEE